MYITEKKAVFHFEMTLLHKNHPKGNWVCGKKLGHEPRVPP